MMRALKEKANTGPKENNRANESLRDNSGDDQNRIAESIIETNLTSCVKKLDDNINSSIKGGKNSESDLIRLSMESFTVESSFTRSTETISGCSSGSKKVRFNFVEIQHYESILSDNPCCSSVPPIGIGWKHGVTLRISIDDYERSQSDKISTINKENRSFIYGTEPDDATIDDIFAISVCKECDEHVSNEGGVTLGETTLGEPGSHSPFIIGMEKFYWELGRLGKEITLSSMIGGTLEFPNSERSITSLNTASNSDSNSHQERTFSDGKSPCNGPPTRNMVHYTSPPSRFHQYRQSDFQSQCLATSFLSDSTSFNFQHHDCLPQQRKAYLPQLFNSKHSHYDDHAAVIITEDD